MRRLLPLYVCAGLLLAGAPRAAAAPDDPAYAAFRATRISVDVVELWIADAFRRVGDAAGVVVIPDANIMEQAADRVVTLRVVDTPAGEVLDTLCRWCDGAVVWADGVAVVTTAEFAAVESQTFAVIDVRGLLRPRAVPPSSEPLLNLDTRQEPVTASTLAEIAGRIVAPELWEQLDAIACAGGRLVVRAPADAVREIRRVIDLLERAEQRAASIDLRVYRAPLGTAFRLAPEAVVDGADADALFAGLAKEATLANTFAARVPGNRAVGVSDITEEMANGATIESGLRGELFVLVDQRNNACVVDAALKQTADRTTDALSRADIRIRARIPDGATLVHVLGDAATGGETIVTISAAIVSRAPFYSIPPDDPRDADLRLVLKKPVTMHFGEGVSFREFYEAIAAQTGATVAIDPSVDRRDRQGIEPGVYLDAERIPAAVALDLVERGGSVTSHVEEGRLWVGTSEAWQRHVGDTVEIHDAETLVPLVIRDFAGPTIHFDNDYRDDGYREPEEVVIEPMTRWLPDLVRSMAFFGGDEPHCMMCGTALVVRATPQEHAEVDALLRAFDRDRCVAVDATVISPTASAFAALFPPGRPRANGALTADEVATLTRDARVLATARFVEHTGTTRHLSSTRQQALAPSDREGKTPITEAGLTLSLYAEGSSGVVHPTLTGTLALRGSSGALRTRGIDFDAPIADGATWAAAIGGPAPGEAAPAVLLVRPRVIFDNTVTR